MINTLCKNNIQQNTNLLIEAANRGDIEGVKCLIPISNPKLNGSEALRTAAASGHSEIVKILIPVSEPQIFNNQSLTIASQNGHIECVKLLIPVSILNNKVGESHALLKAIQNGHNECVKLLAPVSNTNSALLIALIFQNKEAVEILYSHSDPYDTLERLKLHSQGQTENVRFFEEYIIQREKEMLNKSIKDIQCNTVKKQRKI